MKRLLRAFWEATHPYHFLIAVLAMIPYMAFIAQFGLHPALYGVLIIFFSPVSLKTYIIFYDNRDSLINAYEMARLLFNQKGEEKE